jgi:hypothetical protein
LLKNRKEVAYQSIEEGTPYILLSEVYPDTLKENDMKHKHLLVGLLLLAAAMALVACGTPSPTAEATPCPEAPPCPDCPEAPACPDCPECPEPEVALVPFEEEWANSPHNDAEAEAFTHWDEDDPAEIPRRH